MLLDPSDLSNVAPRFESITLKQEQLPSAIPPSAEYRIPDSFEIFGSDEIFGPDGISATSIATFLKCDRCSRENRECNVHFLPAGRACEMCNQKKRTCFIDGVPRRKSKKFRTEGAGDGPTAEYPEMDRTTNVS
jgi:hypothetical protein